MCKNGRIFLQKKFFSTLAILAQLIILVSCDNLFNGGSENPSGTTPEPSGKTISTCTIHGMLNTEGALPSELVPLNTTSERSALPALPEVSYNIDIYDNNTLLSESDGISIEIQTTSEGTSYTVSGLTFKQYTLVATASVSNQVVLKSQQEQISLSSETSDFSRDFVLRPLMNETGFINLEGIIEGDAPDSCVVVLTKAEPDFEPVTWEVPLDSVTDGRKFTLVQPNSDGIASGSYYATISFYKRIANDPDVTDDDLLFPTYIIDDVINVCDGLTTSVWVKNGNAPHLVQSGDDCVCRITSSMREAFLATNFFVDADGDDENGDGSYFNPFATLDKTFQFIKATDKEYDFTVRITGTIDGGVSVNTDSVGNKLTSLKIKSAVAANAVLDASDAGTSVLAVSVTVPVRLENLTLTHGNVTGNGGGIQIASGADVTLMNCAVTGNSASSFGGGIYNAGTLALTDTTVTANTAATGGGVYNNGTFEISGEITVTNNANGNVYLPDEKLITVTGELTGSHIGVKTNTYPQYNNPIKITANFAENTSVSAGTVFTSDDGYIIKLVSGEVWSAVTGGSGSITPRISDDIMIACDNVVSGTLSALTFTVKIDGTNDITDEVKNTFGFAVRIRGSVRDVPSTYYSSNGNVLTLKNLAVGTYNITVDITYRGIGYSQVHTIEVVSM